MLKNDQIYFKNVLKKSFKVCLAIFQHYERKGSQVTVTNSLVHKHINQITKISVQF